NLRRSTVAKKSEKITKKLEDYQKNKPVQLLLFEMIGPEERKYSNTIELYDAIPKYHWGNVERINGEFLRSFERPFEFRGIKYRVKIRPARLDDKDGTDRDYYPSEREELVEDALRKLACDGKGLFLDDQAGVIFSLYELQQELARMGHTYSIAQIKDALLICAKTHMEVTTDDGAAVVISSLFETLGLNTREDWKEHGKKAKAFVRFNILVTNSIKNRTFRQLNYDKCMSYRRVISRRLHKRLSHHYIQANMVNTYEILLSTIIRDFGIKAYADIRNNLREVKLALEEMKIKEVLSDYKVEKIFAPERKNRIIDAKFILSAHSRFISEMIHANERHKKIREHTSIDSQWPKPEIPTLKETRRQRTRFK
ncbi:MAG: hypothetical protein AB1489_43500, partial [Acidobacteriota bacterium]